MTDKKKLDEAVTLTMNGGTDDQGVTVSSTVQANDMVELAMILKRAGITSAMYEGPASISDDGTDGISTTINAPNLRAIMNMMEPVFQATGDLEAGVDDMAQDMEVPAEEPCVDGACDAPVDAFEPEVDMGNDLDTPVDGAIVTENVDDDQFDALDAVTQGPALTSGEGTEDVNCGDQIMSLGWVRIPNAVREDESTWGEYFDHAERIEALANPPVGYTLDNHGIYTNEYDADNSGAEFVSIAFGFYVNTGEVEESTTMVAYPGIADRKPVQPKTKMVPARSGDNPLAEASDNTGSFSTWILTPFDMSSTDEVEVTVHYHYDSGDFDTGLDSPSVANAGATITIEEVIAFDGKDLLDYLSGSQLEGLEQEALDYHNGQGMGVEEAFDPNKAFPDTEQGAIEAMQYLSGHDMTGATAKPDPMVDGVWLVTHQNGRSIVYLNQGDFEDIDEAAKPKTFKDYVREAELNELSGDLKARYVSKAQASKDKHEKRASELDDLVHDAHGAERMGVIRKGAADRVARERNRHDRTAWKREKGLDRIQGYTAEDLMQEFRVDELSNDTKNSYFKKAADSINIHAQHAANQRGIGNDEQARKHDAKLVKRAQGMNRAIAREENELDEAGRTDWQAKARQYGEPYYLNTDCGYASLESIMAGSDFFNDIPDGLAQHSTKIGFTIVEIDRNGKKGYNFINSPDGRLTPGTPVTCITQTSTGQKFRPGKFITSFNTKDLSLNYDQVVAELSKLGITPSKKLPVKTFD